MSDLEVPAAFRKRFAEHNRQAILASILAAVLSALCWLLAFGLVYWVVLFTSTVKRGVETVAPQWVTPVFLGVAAILFLFAALDYAFFRFAPLEDRPVLGLHLIKEFAFALPRLTFAVFGNLLACRILSRDDLQRAWRLLRRIHDDKKSDYFTLSQVEPDARRLHMLLTSLQFAGFIDLHRSEESWFYLIRGEQLELVNTMIKGSLPSSED